MSKGDDHYIQRGVLTKSIEHSLTRNNSTLSCVNGGM